MRIQTTRMAALVLTVWSVASGIRAADLVEDSRFVVPRQSQVRRFLVEGPHVYASVVVEEPVNAGNQNDPRPRRKNLLAAWDLKGKLLWQSELPSAYQLTMARGQLVLAHDDGTLQAQRELIWVDAANGKVVRRVALEGRPLQMAYYPDADRIVLLQMPQHRLQTLKDAWMEVVAFDMEGKQAWLWKIDATELTALRLDAKTVVVGTQARRIPVIHRLDPRTGKDIWSAWWGEPVFGGTQRKVGEQAPPFTPDRVLAVPLLGEVGFLDLELCAQTVDPETGKAAGERAPLCMPWPANLPAPTRLYHHGDRLYFSVWELKGITLGAVELPSGKLLWAEETGTVSYGPPIFWGDRVVFQSHRLTGGRVGTVDVTELRVYDSKGKLLVHQLKKAPEWWEVGVPAQVVADRLYVVRNSELVALRWVEKK